MKLLNFYQDHANQVIIPFWTKAIDKRNGGVYTCFSNTGSELLSKDKYTWSQGRFIWLWSRLAELSENGFVDGNSELYLEHAKKTVDFIRKHAMLENGNVAFLLSEEGCKKESIPGKGYDISFYADCFVILGYAEYARIAKDKDVFHEAREIYKSVLNRINNKQIRTHPYPVPSGLKAHSVPMIMLNVTEQLAYTAHEINYVEEEFNDLSLLFLKEVIEQFYCDDGLVIELMPEQGSDSNTILCRHLNPGHTIESMWFVISSACRIGKKEWIQKAAKAIKKAFHLGWDKEYGGLFRYVDIEGGKPRGEASDHPFEKMILNTWDTKLWWPHSEALYSTMLAYKYTGDKDFLTLYDQTHDYVFNTFPNSDRNVGEWIQIRDRQGRPIDTLVALPVKDPFHILRSILLMIELMREKYCVPKERIRSHEANQKRKG